MESQVKFGGTGHGRVDVLSARVVIRRSSIDSLVQPNHPGFFSVKSDHACVVLVFAIRLWFSGSHSESLSALRDMPPLDRFLLNPHLKTTRLQPVDATSVQKFHEQLPDYRVSSLHELPELADELQFGRLFVKDESSRFGLPAFKILGASWGTYRSVCARLELTEEDIPFDVVAEQAQSKGLLAFSATAGNHGRAVSYIARLLGIPAQIFVPKDLDDHTKDVIANEGAEIHLSENYDHAVKDAETAAANTDGVLVQDTAWPGYEEIPNWITDGYTTMFREIDHQLGMAEAHLTHIITPVGVGSLAHAVVKHYKSTAHQSVKVLTVEPQTAACLMTSLHAGKAVSIDTGSTICNGMNCGTVSSTAWPDLRDHVDGAILVNDLEAHAGVERLSRLGLEAGPCGGASLAALTQLTVEQKASLGLHRNSVVVMLCTEGKRPYSVAAP